MTQQLHYQAFIQGIQVCCFEGAYAPNVRKEPKCPSMDEWIKKMWYIYTMEYYSAIQRNEILPFATTWMELEGIKLSEMTQSEKDKNHMTSLIGGL